MKVKNLICVKDYFDKGVKKRVMQKLPYDYLKMDLKINMSNRIKNLINSQLYQVTFRKGCHPIHAGDEVTFFYAIKRGLVRGYYINENGVDITKCFSNENGFFGSECFRTNKPSTFHVECIEDCECIKIPYSFVREAITLDSGLGEYIQQKYLEEIEKLEIRTKDLLQLSAEERYSNFMKEYPWIKDRIPLKLVASYIGINAGSLSRIRKAL